MGVFERRRAAVVGTGLIGGSIGMALRQQGWVVSGVDRDEERAARAVELGALDVVGVDPNVEITFVATPVRSIVGAAEAALAETTGLITDVGSVKGSIVEAIDHPRFVGGHPMAGSEQEGVEGADPNLFSGAVWVLTPNRRTSDETYTRVRSIVAALGAEIVSLPPERHDKLVAFVSHVPHLTAASLMTIASEQSDDRQVLLRLAAGGFRDMTRIASGHPGIWPDICGENRDAILAALDQLMGTLRSVRRIVAADDHDGLVELLDGARAARMNLPARFGRPARLTEVLVPIPDEAGVLADVTTRASEIDVSILDLEISHSAEGTKGVLHLLVEADRSDELVDRLSGAGYKPSTRALV
jgi:prephenate dehydrogenase